MTSKQDQKHTSDYKRGTGTLGQMADEFYQQMSIEFAKAWQKYPAPNPNTSALTGEAGEAAEAMGKEPFSNVYVECVQTAVMAMRLALEGDPYLDIYRASIGLDLSSSKEEVSAITVLSAYNGDTPDARPEET